MRDGVDDDEAKKEEEEEVEVPPAPSLPLAKRAKTEGWEARMGSEFRGARATGHHGPVPDGDVDDDARIVVHGDPR